MSTIQAVKYAGSKRKLLPFILKALQPLKVHTILDGFAGTTQVGQCLSQQGYRILSNDVSDLAYVFGVALFHNPYPATAYTELLAHLNALPPVAGWFTQYYGGDQTTALSVGADGLKKPWSYATTEKLDAIRTELDTLDLSVLERAVALTSLILALDQVDSTLGHHSAYLRQWSARSYQPLVLRHVFPLNYFLQHEVYQHNVMDLLPKVQPDLAYYDPPYGSSNLKMPSSRVRYAAYYHLWTTVIRNDQPPVFGKSWRRLDSKDSERSTFESFRRTATGQGVAEVALHQLLTATTAPYLLLSYSTSGHIPMEIVLDLCRNAGKILHLGVIEAKRHVMAEMTWTQEWTTQVRNCEYLILVQR